MASDVQIKGTRNGLVICLPVAEFDEIKKSLETKLQQAKGFFAGARFVLREQDKAIDLDQKRQLEELLVGHGMIPIHPEEYRQPLLIPRNEPPSEGGCAAPGPPPGEPAELVNRSLRSGQRVHNLSGNIVILGNVHRGAVVEASGSVMIFGTCAGTVRAGARGETKACVVSLEFASPNLAIAGVQARDIPATPVPGFKKIRLKEGRIVLGQA